jgi:hypothetical protein
MGLCVRERLGTRQNCNDEEKGHFLMFFESLCSSSCDDSSLVLVVPKDDDE